MNHMHMYMHVHVHIHVCTVRPHMYMYNVHVHLYAVNISFLLIQYTCRAPRHHIQRVLPGQQLLHKLPRPPHSTITSLCLPSLPSPPSLPSDSRIAVSLHHIVKQHVVVEEMRYKPLGALGLLCLLLACVELGKRIHNIRFTARHHQHHWRETRRLDGRGEGG